MQVSPIFLHLFTTRVERILHLKGNFTGPVLEMTVVLDHSVSLKQMREYVPALLRALKQHSEVFRNVRLNVTDWRADSQIETRVLPMLTVMGNGFYEDYRQEVNKKRIELLYGNLKFYHARSKLILLFADNSWYVKDEKKKEEALKPFLGRKLLLVRIGEDGVTVGD